MRMLLYLCLFLVSQVSAQPSAQPSEFDEAQRAAAEGRYNEVITLLTAAIKSETLGKSDLAVAYSNRGIAYSLLKQHDLAQQDLQSAYKINPTHQLTLNHLGILAEHIDEDFETAADWYARAAALGYPASQVNLGNLYRNGKGVRRSYAKAVSLYQQAVEQDYVAAKVPLGELYLDGAGVERDYVKALDYLRSAVEADVVTGHFGLGRAYEKGRGVPQDFELALDHYMQSAVKGHAPSQSAIGFLYRRGMGVEKNFIEAVKWYSMAAEQGDASAANRLAWLLATCPVKDVCNGHVALEFAEQAVRSNPTPQRLDSLAAAYARIGEFDRAIEIIAEIGSDPELTQALRDKYARRLDRYQHGIPYQL